MAESLGIGSQVSHPSFGKGVIVAIDSSFYKIYFHELDQAKDIGRSYEQLETVSKVEADVEPIDYDHILKIVQYAIEQKVDTGEPVELGSKWIGGTMELNPADNSMQSKTIPIEAFFHKIVMVRDRLRVLEQNINSSKTLNDEEKIHVQQYITRAYGSLTTFNILFANKEEQFKGAGK